MILNSGFQSNGEIAYMLHDGGFVSHSNSIHHCAIEDIASYGMAVGKEVFRTCKIIGRFSEIWYRSSGGQEPIEVERRLIKLHHCHSSRATDANIRQALIDRFGKPGTKSKPGFTYGLKAHTWQAFALSVYAADTENARRQGAA
jgi:hypothetical protein